MGSRIQCFLMTPIARGRFSLRRYEKRMDASGAGTCPGRYGYHNADVSLGEDDYPDDGYFGGDLNTVPHDDPRWPSKCDGCPYVFLPEDHWQHHANRLFAGAPDGELYTTRDMPQGAIWLADWWPEKGPDGRCYACSCPPGGDRGYWLIDGKAKDGGRWSRTGEAPRLTVTPSILTPHYHGFLTDGFLVEC